jgi:hypothetical protein
LQLNYTMDSDLYFRCNQESLSFLSINKVIAAYRRHDGTKTLKGWRESIAYKEQFYYRKLKNLDEKTAKLYRPKIQRLMFGHYLKSISNRDTLFERAQKILLAIREYPRVITSTYQWYRFYRILAQRKIDES